MNITPICPYCNSFSVAKTGKDIYPTRTDLHYKHFYACPNECDAYVGCHPESNRPLGRLANKGLRLAKSAAHRAFDPFWKGSSATMNRKTAYAKLASALNIKVTDCHIGNFDEAMCNSVMRVCREIRASK